MASIDESELQSELEQELHELHDGEMESESEFESESFLGGIGNVLGGLPGESEVESESEFEGIGRRTVLRKSIKVSASLSRTPLRSLRRWPASRPRWCGRRIGGPFGRNLPLASTMRDKNLLRPAELLPGIQLAPQSLDAFLRATAFIQ
jgi:hypothetical protein